MVFFLILLYALVLPYLGLMVMVIVGMYRRDETRLTDARPSVSVIIPAHDEERHLPETLASLARQRYPGPVEFVIVDDRSKDATAEIIREFARRDDRFRLVQVEGASKRLSPKVNAVNHGIMRSTGEVIVTSDADCYYPEGWLEGMVSHFTEGVVMVAGYVETTRAHGARSWLERFETTDWLSLMLTSRSMTRFGWKFASSANNQAYLRRAFEAVGGFGASGRAPSGDEDLLTQRLGRLPGSKIAFAELPSTRVLTRPMPSLPALLRQRRRWVSRYHHLIHYRPAFIAGISVLGLQSVALTLAALLWPLAPTSAPWIFGLWGVKLAIESYGMWLGTRQLDRRDLWPASALVWALLHPAFISTSLVWSLVRPGDWRAGAARYRSRYLKRQLQQLGRRVRAGRLRS